MKSTNDDNDLFGGWFEQGELPAAPEEAAYEEISLRRSGVGVVIAAISATALILVMVFASRV